MGPAARVALVLAALLVLLRASARGRGQRRLGQRRALAATGGDGLAGRYPLTNYSLDQHFDAVEASLTGGVKCRP